MHYVLLVAGIWGVAHLVDKTGEAISDTGDGVAKIGVTAAVLFLGAKYFRVL